MKKRFIIGAGGVVYTALVVALCMGVFGKDVEEQTQMQTEVAQEPTEEPISIEPENIEPESLVPDREFPIVENGLVYATQGQESVYAESDDVVLLETDKQDIRKVYQLPELKRMSEEDADTFMADIQVFQKIEELGIDTELFFTPEYNWKAIYNDSLIGVDKALQFQAEAVFEGSKASELNAFLAENGNAVVKIASEEIVLDEVIRVPSNVVVDGQGVVLTGENAVDYAILLENVENVSIRNMKLKSGFGQGIYVIESNHVLIWNNEITNAIYKALCVMGTNSYVNIVNNSIYENGNGAIFVNGDVSHCILEGNAVYQNRGTRNLTAGIVFSAMEVEDKYTPYNVFKDEYLYDLVHSPNNNVVKDNLIQGNYSSGFYCDGGYMNYVIHNTIEDNEKEGMCLDYGTFGTYVSENTIRRNGVRNRQTDEDLEADFILGAGRLEDGSSTAKLPGISIDNSAYNIVSGNTITDNSGSGVKVVRSGYRNLILSNLILDNNRGKNHAFHGFGIEFGHASTPDEPVIGLDFTAAFENIAARNIVSGKHYAGIFLAEGSYCNDLIDNTIMDSDLFSVENHSVYFNSAVGNKVNVGTLDIELK